MDEKTIEQLLDYVRHRYFGKYRGTVTDTNDTTKRGRVKVQLEAALGGLAAWAMPCFPYAGNGVGLFAIPEVGSGVWVEFEGGDLSYPIYTGGFWANNEVPNDEKGQPAVPDLKIIRSKKGMIISFNDGTQELIMSDENGENIINIQITEGKIMVKGALKVVVESPLIELVENATHPVVFGDELMTYLNQVVNLYNSHMHPGELALGSFPVTPAPPLPLLTPPTPVLISTKVKAG